MTLNNYYHLILIQNESETVNDSKENGDEWIDMVNYVVNHRNDIYVKCMLTLDCLWVNFLNFVSCESMWWVVPTPDECQIRTQISINFFA